MVYVGDIEYSDRGMIMSHMAATDLEELHLMADRIGLSRKHFQDDKYHPHYAVCKSMKKLALKYGAEEMNDRDLMKVCHPTLINFLNGGEYPE